MTYKNDFGFNAETIEMPNASWNDQPISVPLHVWDTLRDRLSDVEHELSDSRRMWADANARVRQLENENAQLKGDIDAMLSVEEEVD